MTWLNFIYRPDLYTQEMTSSHRSLLSALNRGGINTNGVKLNCTRIRGGGPDSQVKEYVSFEGDINPESLSLVLGYLGQIPGVSDGSGRVIGMPHMLTFDPTSKSFKGGHLGTPCNRLFAFGNPSLDDLPGVSSEGDIRFYPSLPSTTVEFERFVRAISNLEVGIGETFPEPSELLNCSYDDVVSRLELKGL